MHILITGTSSSGKTSVAKEFNKRYKKIYVDDYGEKAYVKTFSKLKNDFYNPIEIDQLHYLEVRKMMGGDAKKYKNVIIDDIDPTVLRYLPKSTKKVLLYTNLKDLTRNLIRRRKTDPRKNFIYEQFAENYVKTNDKAECIDKINLNDFKKMLNKVKWNFSSEKELNLFAKNIFLSMGIKDSKTHCITNRHKIYDLVVSTEHKKPNQVKDDIITGLKEL
ncbi:hypothetical protein CPAV1605_1415 [seawater metagenome]|uniref:AAA domain n=1 Tax=seawater metagenome TaxID=1561972 RepID=A0A5E8CMB4_9ZZZZ